MTAKRDLIIADKLVHASIIDGIRLSEAQMLRYRHLDYEHLHSLLVAHREEYDNVFIVTESVFSMDGDTADLQQLCEIKKEFDAFLYVDEAHAVGVRGTNGLGCCEEQACVEDIDFIVGTFGKALASQGAFVICEQLFRDYLINTQRSLIFTTALPPVNVAWTRFVLNRLPDFMICAFICPRFPNNCVVCFLKKDSRREEIPISSLCCAVPMRIAWKWRTCSKRTVSLPCLCAIRLFPRMRRVSVFP